MMDFFHNHEVLLWWSAVISAVLFLGTLLVLPFLVAQIPQNYFAEEKRRPLRLSSHRHQVLHGLIALIKNILGLILIVLGVIMLVVPGQGLVTIIVGLMLTNFPGKYRVQRWIIQRSTVQLAINWLRARTNHPPLEFSAVVQHQPDR